MHFKVLLALTSVALVAGAPVSRSTTICSATLTNFLDRKQGTEPHA